MKLYEIAHSRAGDKGNTLILSVIPYDEGDYPFLCRLVTAEKVARHFEGRILGNIVRYEMPNVCALQFVCRQALAGGVTTSLVMDTHGKTMSYALLEMEIFESDSL